MYYYVILRCDTYYTFRDRVCSLRYPARNKHAPYYVCPAPLHNIFLHYLMNGTIFGKTSLNIYITIFSTTFV